MKLMAVLILSLLLFACAQKEMTSSTKKPVTKTETTAQPAPEVPVLPINCTDPDGNDPNLKSKVVVKYDNGQKESFSDYCGEGEFAFQIEYLCDGVNVKTKINKCNETCSDGMCG